MPGLIHPAEVRRTQELKHEVAQMMPLFLRKLHTVRHQAYRRARRAAGSSEVLRRHHKVIGQCWIVPADDTLLSAYSAQAVLCMDVHGKLFRGNLEADLLEEVSFDDVLFVQLKDEELRLHVYERIESRYAMSVEDAMEPIQSVIERLKLLAPELTRFQRFIHKLRHL